MKKVVIILISLFFPVIAMAAITSVNTTTRTTSCPDYCTNGNFYYDGVLDPSGVCTYQDKRECKYGCDEGKCVEGKDCPSKCEDDVFFYNGSFSARTKDCAYEEKECEFGCGSRGCKSEPVERRCDDRCQNGTFYSGGSYNQLQQKCQYENEKNCLCDSKGENCIDLECSDRCQDGVAYSDGAPTADAKCKYQETEKCENGCDAEGKICLKCESRCYNGNYYFNGNVQNVGAGKKACVFEEKICDAGCAENEGCLKCQKDADCSAKSVCKNGTILGGWCTKGISDEQLSLFGSSVLASGCAYNLIGSCPSGVCNPIYEDMCGIIIGPAAYEDSADGKIKPLLGVKVSAVWKKSSGSESLPERMTDETGHVYFTDEEKYRYFSDKDARLEITASIENSGKGFQISPVAQTTISRVIEVKDVSTYKVNLIFGDVSNENAINIFFNNGEKEKEKTYQQADNNKFNQLTSEVIKWFEDLEDSVTGFFNKP